MTLAQYNAIIEEGERLAATLRRDRFEQRAQTVEKLVALARGLDVAVLATLGSKER